MNQIVPSQGRDQTLVAEQEAQRAFAVPSVDVFESKLDFLLLADLPGVAANDVKIEVDRGTLSLKAPRKDQALDYNRKFRLNVAVDPEGIEAKLEFGVLRLRLPKSKSAQPRTVAVLSE